MENDNKEQLLIEFWSKLKTALIGHMRNYSTIHRYFIGRSDIENGTAEINNEYLQENKTIIENALKDDATEEDNEMLTEYLKKVGFNNFRYKFREKNENGITKEYRFSFEEDKMVVNIRDYEGNRLSITEFEYKNYFRIFFDDIIGELVTNNEQSIFFRKNIYDSSIANTVLKYYFKNTITDFGDFFVPYFEQNCLKVSDALIRISLEIGNINLYKYCLSKSYGTKEELIRRLPNIAKNAFISDNTEIIAEFESELEKNGNISDFLQIACTDKNIGVDLIAYLFNNYKDRYSGYDLIRLLSYVYDPRVARMIFYELLSIGCDIYDIDNNKYCLITLCSIAGSGNIEVMQYILGELSKILTEEQIDYIINNSRNQYCKQTVLTTTIIDGNIDMVRFLLLRPRIDINVRNGYGETSLCMAIECGYNEIIKLLLTDNNIDVNKTDKKGTSPLNLAIKNHNNETVKFLLTNEKIDINKADINGMTPLCTAVIRGNIEIVRLLLTNEKFDVNTINRSKESPLYYASKANDIEIIRLLSVKEPNIDINRKEYSLFEEHFSPLESCLRSNNFNDKSEETFKYLLGIKAHYINKGIKDVKDKQKEIDKQIEILENMKNKYTIHKTFIKKAIENFKAYSDYNEIEKSKCNIF